MKKTAGTIAAGALCAALLLTACGKRDTPFTQPDVPAAGSGVQGTEPMHPFASSASTAGGASAPAPSASVPGASSGAASSGAAASSGTTGASSGTTAASSSAGTSASGALSPRSATVRADGGLRLRATASEEGEKLLVIPDGALLTCSGWENGWVKTTYDGQTGYVLGAYLLYHGRISADGGLRLRNGPGESYEKLLTIPNGTTIACQEQKDGWIKTSYDNKTGYVSQEYVEVSARVDAGPGLNLRKTAGESGEKLLTIPNGTTVQCVGNCSGEWVKVKYNGYEGYVSAQYLAFG